MLPAKHASPALGAEYGSAENTRSSAVMAAYMEGSSGGDWRTEPVRLVVEPSFLVGTSGATRSHYNSPGFRGLFMKEWFYSGKKRNLSAFERWCEKIIPGASCCFGKNVTTPCWVALLTRKSDARSQGRPAWILLVYWLRRHPADWVPLLSPEPLQRYIEVQTNTLE